MFEKVKDRYWHSWCTFLCLFYFIFFKFIYLLIYTFFFFDVFSFHCTLVLVYKIENTNPELFKVTYVLK